MRAYKILIRLTMILTVHKDSPKYNIHLLIPLGKCLCDIWCCFYFKVCWSSGDKFDDERSRTSCKCSSVSSTLNLILVNFIDENNGSHAQVLSKMNAIFLQCLTKSKDSETQSETLIVIRYYTSAQIVPFDIFLVQRRTVYQMENQTIWCYFRENKCH